MRLLKQLMLTLVGACAFLCMLSSIAYTQITNSSQMLKGFYQFADTSLKGVSATAYPDYAKAVTGYMTGAQADLTVKAADGTERPGFSERELAHMADVRGLVRGLNLFRFVTGGLALLGFGLNWWSGRKKGERETAMKAAVKGAAVGSYLLLGLLLALAVWGAVNFTGLFVTFHRVFFSNDLWLLNPREHLLIMLMPTPFFVWYVKQIALGCWPILALMLLLPLGYWKIFHKQEH